MLTLAKQEDAVRIRTTVIEAAKMIHVFTLGEGQINDILSKTSLHASIEQRIALAGAMATLFAETARAQPKNISAAPEGPAAQAAAFGWTRGIDGWPGGN